MAAKAKTLETDLFDALARHLRDAGWDVHGEVNHIDLVATRDGETLAVEIKTSLNFTLLAQAVDRQRYMESVWIAVPEECLGRPGSARNRMLRVIRRLELGLFSVHPATGRVKALLPPAPFDRAGSERRSRHKGRAVLDELKGRELRINRGGSQGVPIMTAYREAALRLARALKDQGPARPSELRPPEDGKNRTYRILYQNHYGWFVRQADATYTLSEAGAKALEDWAEKGDTSF